LRSNSKASISFIRAHISGQKTEIGNIFFYPSRNCFHFYLLIHQFTKLNAACVSRISVSLLSTLTYVVLINFNTQHLNVA
jgi:hypothetical protein